LKERILASLRPVLAHPRHVDIDAERVRAFCRERPAGGIALPDWRKEFIYPWDDEKAADFFLLFNCVNFAFWAKPGAVKWNIDYKGQRLDGAYGLMGAFTRAVEEGVPLLDGSFLAAMTEETLGRILRGDGELVLFRERAEILREVGAGLVARHGGNFRNLLDRARGSAVALAELLVREFPSFNDACRMDGGELLFYKRAQLAPAMVYQRFQGKGPGSFRDTDRLTVFADYKLPQALRRLGVLRYRPDLAAKVDSLALIPPCSREEVEIRASTIGACDMIQREYAAGGQRMDSVTLDAFLWLLGHEKVEGEKPYHLTETIYY
jgi:hypothetical protein